MKGTYILAFLREPEPRRREAILVLPGIRRIVANNPSLMTYHGTNTYLIETSDGSVIIDPGPDDDGHLDDVTAATHGAVSAILLSHTHSDHLGATSSLKVRTGAPTFAFHRPADPSFEPDVLIQDGDAVAGMIAIHTPGHASDHLCFARPDGVVFSADHVMSWSSSIVSPPDGNMAAYCNSLRVMLSREDRLYLPGHGPALPNPQPYVADLLKRRIQREEEIFAALGDGPTTAWDLMDRLYSKTDLWLRRAAERNVLAHLDKLHSEALVEQIGDRWQIRRAV